MVKKISKTADAAAPKAKASIGSGLLDSHLAQTIKDSAQQIWLAGQGAFAKAQGEGTKVVDNLIKEGANLQRKTQAAAGEKLGDMASKVTAMAGEVGQKANAQWDKLETIFEERTARALRSLGMPTAMDLAALSARVDALTKAAAKAPAGTTAKSSARSSAGSTSRSTARSATPTATKAAAKTPAKPRAKKPGAPPAVAEAAKPKAAAPKRRTGKAGSAA